MVWSCSVCTVDNFEDSASRCECCGEPRKTLAQEKKESPWNCAGCGIENEPEAGRCDCCGEPRTTKSQDLGLSQSTDIGLSQSGDFNLDDNFNWASSNRGMAELLKKQVMQAHETYFNGTLTNDLKVNYDIGAVTVNIPLKGVAEDRILKLFDLNPVEPVLVTITYDSHRFGNEEKRPPQVTLQQRGSASLAMQKNVCRELARRFVEQNFEKEIVEVLEEDASQAKLGFHGTFKSKTKITVPPKNNLPTLSQINQVAEITGLEPFLAQCALEKHSNNVEVSVEFILSNMNFRESIQPALDILELGFDLTYLQAVQLLSQFSDDPEKTKEAILENSELFSLSVNANNSNSYPIPQPLEPIEDPFNVVPEVETNNGGFFGWIRGKGKKKLVTPQQTPPQPQQPTGPSGLLSNLFVKKKPEAILKSHSVKREYPFFVGLIKHVINRIANYSVFCIICQTKHSCNRASEKPVICSKPLCMFRYEEFSLGMKHGNVSLCPFNECPEFLDPNDPVMNAMVGSDKTKNMTLETLLDMYKSKYSFPKYLPHQEMLNFAEKGVQANGLTIKRITNVMKPSHVFRFEQKWEELNKLRGGTVKPEMVYHGTSEQNVPSIIERGLLVPGIKTGVQHATDSGWWGRGIYLSPNAATSCAYCRGKMLFICSVIMGRVFKCTNRMDGKPLVSGYDSHQDPSGQEYIIFDEAQIQLCYLVEFN